LNVFNKQLQIVIAGGTGQVGRVISRHFHSQGHSITILSRQPEPAPWPVIEWNGRDPGSWAGAINGADVVINLAGRSVNCRYHPKNRRQIIDSRIFPTRAIGQAIAQADNPPALWMNAATATIYCHSLDRDMDELNGEFGGNEPGVPETWNFSIDVAKRWEQEFLAAPTPRTRKIALRSAMVMSPDSGGIFSTLRTLVQLGLSGRAGSGRQYVSWIHHTDFARALDFLIVHPHLQGPINICSPNPLPYVDFMRCLRYASGVPIGVPATRWMLEVGAFILRTETELVLKSRRVAPRILLDSGFTFDYPDWPAAARDLVRGYREGSAQPGTAARAQ
jgi:uncharacterized protein